MEYTLHPNREQQHVSKDAHHGIGLCLKNYLNYSCLLGQSLHSVKRSCGSSRTNTLQCQPATFTYFSGDHHSIQSSTSCFLAQVPHYLSHRSQNCQPATHRNGFSPVCVRMCFLRSLCVVKYLLQPSDSQLNVFPV